MSLKRTLVLAKVTAIREGNISYPSCCLCYCKIFLDAENERWVCNRCHHDYPLNDVNHRYRLALTVCDATSQCNVTVFGRCLEPFFGIPAGGLARYLKNVENQLGNGAIDLSQRQSHAVSTTFLGRMFLFGFKTHPTQLPHSDGQCPSEPVTLASIASTSSDVSRVTQRNNTQLPDSDLVAYQLLPASDDDQKSFPTVFDIIQKDVKICLNNTRNIDKQQEGTSMCQDSTFLSSLPSIGESRISLGQSDISCSRTGGPESVLLSCDEQESLAVSKNQSECQFDYSSADVEDVRHVQVLLPSSMTARQQDKGKGNVTQTSTDEICSYSTVDQDRPTSRTCRKLPGEPLCDSTLPSPEQVRSSSHDEEYDAMCDGVNFSDTFSQESQTSNMTDIPDSCYTDLDETRDPTIEKSNLVESVGPNEEVTESHSLLNEIPAVEFVETSDSSVTDNRTSHLVCKRVEASCKNIAKSKGQAVSNKSSPDLGDPGQNVQCGSLEEKQSHGQAQRHKTDDPSFSDMNESSVLLVSADSPTEINREATAVPECLSPPNNIQRNSSKEKCDQGDAGILPGGNSTEQSTETAQIPQAAETIAVERNNQKSSVSKSSTNGKYTSDLNTSYLCNKSVPLSDLQQPNDTSKITLINSSQTISQGTEFENMRWSQMPESEDIDVFLNNVDFTDKQGKTPEDDGRSNSNEGSSLESHREDEENQWSQVPESEDLNAFLDGVSTNNQQSSSRSQFGTDTKGTICNARNVHQLPVPQNMNAKVGENMNEEASSKNNMQDVQSKTNTVTHQLIVQDRTEVGIITDKNVKSVIPCKIYCDTAKQNTPKPSKPNKTTLDNENVCDSAIRGESTENLCDKNLGNDRSEDINVDSKNERYESSAFEDRHSKLEFRETQSKDPEAQDIPHSEELFSDSHSQYIPCNISGDGAKDYMPVAQKHDHAASTYSEEIQYHTIHGECSDNTCDKIRDKDWDECEKLDTENKRNESKVYHGGQEKFEFKQPGVVVSEEAKDLVPYSEELFSQSVSEESPGNVDVDTDSQLSSVVTNPATQSICEQQDSDMSGMEQSCSYGSDDLFGSVTDEEFESVPRKDWKCTDERNNYSKPFEQPDSDKLVMAPPAPCAPSNFPTTVSDCTPKSEPSHNMDWSDTSCDSTASDDVFGDDEEEDDVFADEPAITRKAPYLPVRRNQTTRRRGVSDSAWSARFVGPTRRIAEANASWDSKMDVTGSTRGAGACGEWKRDENINITPSTTGSRKSVHFAEQLSVSRSIPNIDQSMQGDHSGVDKTPPSQRRSCLKNVPILPVSPLVRLHDAEYPSESQELFSPSPPIHLANFEHSSADTMVPFSVNVTQSTPIPGANSEDEDILGNKSVGFLKPANFRCPKRNSDQLRQTCLKKNAFVSAMSMKDNQNNEEENLSECSEIDGSHELYTQECFSPNLSKPLKQRKLNACPIENPCQGNDSNMDDCASRDLFASSCEESDIVDSLPLASTNKIGPQFKAHSDGVCLKDECELVSNINTEETKDGECQLQSVDSCEAGSCNLFSDTSWDEDTNNICKKLF